MKYIASVDRASFPAHVSGEFGSRRQAIKWAKDQSGYNAVVYLRTGWKNVWNGK